MATAQGEKETLSPIRVKEHCSVRLENNLNIDAKKKVNTLQLIPPHLDQIRSYLNSGMSVFISASPTTTHIKILQVKCRAMDA